MQGGGIRKIIVDEVFHDLLKRNYICFVYVCNVTFAVLNESHSHAKICYGSVKGDNVAAEDS